MFLYHPAEMSSSVQENGLADGNVLRIEGSVQPVQQDDVGKRKSRVNWIERELLVLQAARRQDMQRYALGGSKAKKQKTGDQRWKAITEVCASSGVERTPAQCKDKWESLHAEWKRIYNYESDIPTNAGSYWSLTNKERKLHKLPTSFFNTVYSSMAAWCGQPAALDSEEVLMIEAAQVREPADEEAANKSTPTNSPKEDEYELFGGDRGNGQDDMSNLPEKQSKEEQSPGLSVGGERGGMTVQPESLQGMLQMLEKNNELLVSVLSDSDVKRDARHQEFMKFEREKFIRENELARRKLELAEQLGLRYINALHNIGDNIKLLGQAIMHGTKDLNKQSS